MKKTVIIYGLSLAILLLALKTFEYKWMVKDISWQLYVFFIALFFTALGIWVSHRIMTNKNNDSSFQQNTQAIHTLNLSKRELDVLEKLSDGLSNHDIAAQLFVSINTVKTHLKNGFAKLEVNNRVQAINKLKALKIVE